MASESLCLRRILAIVSQKFVYTTRLKIGLDTSVVRHVFILSGFMPVPPPSMTLRHDALPVLPVNARLSQVHRLLIVLAMLSFVLSYEKQGIDAQALARHKTRAMTDKYKEGHEPQWTEVGAGLDINLSVTFEASEG